MNRAVLEACLPCLAALAAAFVLLVGIVRLSEARLQWRRLAALHRCQEGGVQSLSFVLTLPLLVMVLLFIVQVSQLMLGIMVVNYAAFASARAASVWVPAWVEDGHAGYGDDADGQNELPVGILPGSPESLSLADVSSAGSRKYEKIWSAAALACAPISPSRSTPDGGSGASSAGQAATAAKLVYQALDPASSSNPRIPRRLDNKLAYSYANTHVAIQFEDRNSQPVEGTRTYNPIGHPVVTYYESEVGWQDPITVTVYHDFALLPGPGRFLANLLVRADGEADRVSPRIRQESGIYKTRLFASATMTNEGIQSVRPYLHPTSP
jgi:hypothetical protein